MHWTDERGDDHAPCAFCGVDCSTHPDAGNPLAPCGDCGRATCCDHRVDDVADRCVDCAAVFYAQQHKDNLDDAVTRVLDRMGCNGETLEDAAEAIYPDYGGLEFRAAIIRSAQGERS